jgi:hypothetical protein
MCLGSVLCCCLLSFCVVVCYRVCVVVCYRVCVVVCRVSVSCSSLRFDPNLDLVLLVQFHLCGFYSPDVARKSLVRSHSVLAVVDVNRTY